MDSLQKLAAAASETTFEADGCEVPLPSRSPQSSTCGWTGRQIREAYGQRSHEDIVQAKGHPIPIHLAAFPGGKRFPLLKVMLTTACERHCYYCPFQAGRNHPRVTFKPDELAKVVMRAHRAGWIEGVFISTGLFNGGANTQNKILDTAEILRHKLKYAGYMHIKLMPGAERGQVLRAMQLADRLSTNLEAPNSNRLKNLAPEKDFDRELLAPLRWAEMIRRSTPSHLGWGNRWPSTTTQFVVGPAGESDAELLTTVQGLYRKLRLKRVYFEAFSPVTGTPLESHRPENPLRQQRLYEASFLLRDYGFDLEELPFDSEGILPLDRDPKRVNADRTLRHEPVELNRADREMLMRVPGIGRRKADNLLSLRQQGRLGDVSLLRKRGLISERSAPYVTVDGHRPGFQRDLFPAATKFHTD